MLSDEVKGSAKLPGLYAARLQAGISMGELSDACGISEASISSYEMGKRGASGDTREALANALGTSERDLREPTGEKAFDGTSTSGFRESMTVGVPLLGASVAIRKVMGVERSNESKTSSETSQCSEDGFLFLPGLYTARQDARGGRGMSMGELAKITNLSAGSVAGYERGRTRAPVEAVMAIAGALEVDSKCLTMSPLEKSGFRGLLRSPSISRDSEYLERGGYGAGAAIRRRRELLGLSRRELAESVGLPGGSGGNRLGMIERGRAALREPRLAALLECKLGCLERSLLRLAALVKSPPERAASELGSLLAAKRAEYGLSVGDLASLSETSPNRITNLEEGLSSSLPRTQAVQLARALGIDSREMMAHSRRPSQCSDGVSRKSPDAASPESRLLVEARVEAGFSKRELARRCGIGEGSLERMEAGERINTRLAMAIARCLEGMRAFELAYEARPYRQRLREVDRALRNGDDEFRSIEQFGALLLYRRLEAGLPRSELHQESGASLKGIEVIEEGSYPKEVGHHNVAYYEALVKLGQYYDIPKESWPSEYRRSRVAETLIDARLQAGLSQKDLGEGMGLSKGAVNNIERGQQLGFSEENARRAAALLGIDSGLLRAEKKSGRKAGSRAGGTEFPVGDRNSPLCSKLSPHERDMLQHYLRFAARFYREENQAEWEAAQVMADRLEEGRYLTRAEILHSKRILESLPSEALESDGEGGEYSTSPVLESHQRETVEEFAELLGFRSVQALRAAS